MCEVLEIEAQCKENLKKEFIWIQSSRARKAFQSVLACLRECCERLHLGNKCDLRLRVPVSQPQAERHFLAGKQGSDALKAYVTLLGDNVIQAEIVLKHAKSTGGVFRAVAQPDVQWKLQQLQDLGNHIARATSQACEVDERLAELSQYRKFSMETGELILSAAREIKDELCAARTAIVLPRKKSLLELYNFPPTRRFNPPLPQDQLLSFYISSCKLVCASYHMVPKQTAPQGLSITVSECQLAYLEEVLHQLDSAMAHLQKLIGSLEICKKRS
ncbi:Protein rogdi [Trichostrongylus colubriformis]|uniref:Protein rogdi n=1 Tax=Trichostrongylus colubriformis TaxID=6319 RepID=A0AAN8F969_TRICO